MRTFGRTAGIPLGIAFALAACGASPPPAHADVSCTRYASASGSDGNSGSQSSPFRSAQRLQDSLRPGEVGCLAPGQTFEGRLRGNNSGTKDRPIVMTSGPGTGRATIAGEIYIPADTTDIQYRYLVLNGNSSFRVSPSVNGDRIGFYGNDVTDDHHGICFHLGKLGEGTAEDIVIDGNRIHDCGRLPSTGLDHGIYVETARNVRITNNFIYDNADYGVHLYPDAQGTYVANNVIDGNGRGITVSGEGDNASSGNVIVNNTISNSKDTTNLETYWGGAQGSGNRAEGNCLWNGARGNTGNTTGLSISGTVNADPRYVSRGDKNFSMAPGSPCAGKAPAADLAASPASPVPAPSAPAPPSVAPVAAALAPPPVALSTPAAAPRRAGVRPLTLRWLKGREAFVVTTRPFRGRATLVARAGTELVGSCVRTFRTPRRASCYFEISTRSAAARRAVRVAASLPTAAGRQKVRIGSAMPVVRRPAHRLTGPDNLPR